METDVLSYDAEPPNSGLIATFYSFKGGVGRTMALANIAILIAKRGLNVLAVDFDLEAPGLDRYFTTLAFAKNPKGLMDLLLDARSSYPKRPNWHSYISGVNSPDIGNKLFVLTAGTEDLDYPKKVLSFDWRDFFLRSGGGDFLESLRDEWRNEFDVVLIDSRTGITDSGGICTIQLPDVLIPVFTCTEQSLNGAINVVNLGSIEFGVGWREGRSE